MVQLYAAGPTGEEVFVESAVKGVDYYCLECLSKLRLRGGDFRQLHFYHVDENRNCRQSEKTIEHVMTQKWLQKTIEGIQLEVRFPNIGRIADALWREKKIVFEVQVSPMTADECRGRMEDYKKEGLDTIFILHTKTFGRRFATPLEELLIPCTHYFTDITETGGAVFDMLSWIVRGRRLFTQEYALKKLVIDIATLNKYVAVIDEDNMHEDDLALVRLRKQFWRFHAEGDILTSPLLPALKGKAMDFENALRDTGSNGSGFHIDVRRLVASWYRKLIERLYIPL